MLSFTLKTKCGLLRSFVLFSNVFYFFSNGPFCNGQADFERDRQGLLYNLNQLSHAVAEKKVQDRYDGRNFDRDRSDRPSTHWRQESKREAVNSFERHPGLDLQGQGIILKTRTPGHLTMRTDTVTTFFFVFEFSFFCWDIQVSKSDSRLFDDFRRVPCLNACRICPSLRSKGPHHTGPLRPCRTLRPDAKGLGEDGRGRRMERATPGEICATNTWNDGVEASWCVSV